MIELCLEYFGISVKLLTLKNKHVLARVVSWSTTTNYVVTKHLFLARRRTVMYINLIKGSVRPNFQEIKAVSNDWSSLRITV
jgi:hypothetical protein